MIRPDVVIGPVSGDGLARLLAEMETRPSAPNLWELAKGAKP